MKEQIICLIDCNNFYVSCERVFNPKIKNKPVMVLSNNDGCVVSRSEEVKALGIKMGTPVFKCREKIEENDISVFSSNYSLYADMSTRVMETLKIFSPDIEIYSIDEAFLSLKSFKYRNLYEYGKEIKNTIGKWTGIPVSIGIGKTKTLAKVANRFAKRNKELNGVFDISNEDNVDKYLEITDIQNVWGIGHRYSDFLRKNGVRTALKFKNLSEEWVQKKMTVIGRKTLLELKGISCIEIEMIPPKKKGVTCSRSFGRPVEKLDELEEALSVYITRAAEKMRKQKLIPLTMHVFITTNRFKKEPQYANWVDVKLTRPTTYTPELIGLAKEHLGRIFKEGYRYKKVGVSFTGLIPIDEIQQGFFQISEDLEVMKTIDLINQKWGRDMVGFFSSGFKRPWSMKRAKLSKRFTTKWDEIPVIFCD